MAGIGVLLRYHAAQDNLVGLTQAYVLSALASTGPWLLTVIALGTIMLIASPMTSSTDMQGFRVVIIYNFSLSLVMSAPLCAIASRYIADATHNNALTPLPSVMLLALGLMYLSQLPVAVLLYYVIAPMQWPQSLLAIINFLLISTVWLTSICITARKHYGTVTIAFFIGMLTAIMASMFLLHYNASMGMLAGFTIGIGVVASILMAQAFTLHPYPFTSPLHFLGYFRKYPSIALGGLAYNMAIWVDKWLMWLAPEAEKTASGMIMYPNYDSAMFLAYLTIIPSMAMFLFTIETRFSAHYQRFYQDIRNKATLQKIQQNHSQMLASIFSSSGNFLILQGSLCLIAILVAPKLLALLGSSYQQIGIFRYGVMGAFFHALTLFLLILLSYFDNRKTVCTMQLFFLAANILFTSISLQSGFRYYGYGYFLASLLTFLFTMLLTTRYLLHLPYHTFITNNSSVQN